MPDRSAAAIHQQQNVQLGLKLVGIGMLLTTKSWEQSTSHPKDALIFRGSAHTEIQTCYSPVCPELWTCKHPETCTNLPHPHCPVPLHHFSLEQSSFPPTWRNQPVGVMTANNFQSPSSLHIEFRQKQKYINTI